MNSFVAIDFETADNGRDSACAIGLVKVAGNDIVGEAYHLIRPPRPNIVFEYLHGISWSDVKDQPDFAGIWPMVEDFIRGADFIAAHNASFDRGVLFTCCDANGLERPSVPFLCTVKLARKVWDIRPTKLPNVCAHLKIPLNHHHAASDSRACAHIVLHARNVGTDVTQAFLGASKPSAHNKGRQNSPSNTHAPASRAFRARTTKQITEANPATTAGESQQPHDSPPPATSTPDAPRRSDGYIWIWIIGLAFLIWLVVG